MKQLIILVLFILISLQIKVLSQDKTANNIDAAKPALVIIDIQNQFLTMVPDQEKRIAMHNINGYILLFRERNLPIIRVYHTDPEWGPHPDSIGFQYPEDIQIKESDPMIVKNFSNSFKKTELDKILQERKCNTLLLCGLSSVGCVISTYFGAKDLDYKVFMLKDAIMSHNSVYTDNVETMFDAIGYDVVKYILDQTEK